MKAYLMFKDRDFEIKKEDFYGKTALIDDLELEYILVNMAQKDGLIYETCKEALMNSLILADEISYRQDNLSDVLKNASAIRELYEITVETENERRNSSSWLSSHYLSATFNSSVKLLDLYIEMLRRLRLVADNNIHNFYSEGFRKLLIMFQEELDNEYFRLVKSQLKDLRELDGILISSTMGKYLQGTNYVLTEREEKGFWRKWFFAPYYKIAPRDDSAAQDLGDRRNRAINEPTNALAQAAENLQSFFSMLRRELAFYVGCLNLSDTIKEYEMPTCLPQMLPKDSYDRTWSDLYDISLLLIKKSNVIGNEMHAKDKRLYLITGANQGGKTTFLRSLGQSQIMAQCGMFVCAKEFIAPIRDGIYTHFKKEEDDTLLSGKLDEELRRMSDVVNHLNENSLVLLNESFAATNEREGSEINNQITRGLIDSQVEVFAVTHQYTYASSFSNVKGVLYLRANRLEDGTRTFKIVEGEPLVTAYGKDLYREIFNFN